MLKFLKVNSLKELVKETIPEDIRQEKEKVFTQESTLSDQPKTEQEVVKRLRNISNENKRLKSCIGMGYYGTYLPAVIRRHLVEDATWYTAYTPYQAEISQGRLESLINFQTLVTELTGMDASNASLLDEASAAAEAMAMAYRIGGSSSRNVFLVSDKLHGQLVDVMASRAAAMNVELCVADFQSFDFDRIQKKVFGGIVQYPDTEGVFHDYTDFCTKMHSINAVVSVAADPLALTLATPPSAFGADIVIGSLQRFGVPMGFGGPHAAFFATLKKHIRKMPGRIIGVSVDAEGNKAYRMALQTREQHIRRDKATSNICTSQVLLANIAAMYAIYHGPLGLTSIAQRVHALAILLRDGLMEMGYEPIEKENFFDTLTIQTKSVQARAVLMELEKLDINIRLVNDGRVGVSLDETTSASEVQNILRGFYAARAELSPSLSLPTILKKEIKTDECDYCADLPEKFKRKLPFLQQNVFNTHHSETKMMRYIKHLERKDLGLNTSMICLGSCTMKLNPTCALQPILEPQFADIHPFAPAQQTNGYRKMIFQLCSYLCSITGFDACSLQPNSGAMGEYAGLLAIRKYQSSIGEGNRNICLIPESAHGTNPASAVMAGMKIAIIPSDTNGSINLAALKKTATDNKEYLSCLMVTYPSTYGRFDKNIREICEAVHECGGCVYMDGANMNAQLGLTSPAYIGADVCHLNLHKTFSIPHGGGGPGVGPICAKKHIARFFPTHSIVKPSDIHSSGPTVTGSPFGSAMVLPVTWTFINLMGREGLKKCGEYAILNANYMMERLKKDYDVKFVTNEERCAHEFVVDIQRFKNSCGVTEEDIAKRLMDYGFHSPTMSWPVSSALMIEPTESESRDEMDRFCDAMISIRQEIRKIEEGEWPKDDNPLKNAPHSMKEVCKSEWKRSYSREVAAFPAPWILERGKFWPSVSRIDNSYGEKNLVCTCGDLSEYV